jgi:hypothetical protein
MSRSLRIDHVVVVVGGRLARAAVGGAGRDIQRSLGRLALRRIVLSSKEHGS